MRIRRIPLADRASPLAAGLGQGMEGRQGSELRQVALVEFISILRVGREAGKCIICHTHTIFRKSEKGGFRCQIITQLPLLKIFFL